MEFKALVFLFIQLTQIVFSELETNQEVDRKEQTSATRNNIHLHNFSSASSSSSSSSSSSFSSPSGLPPFLWNNDEDKDEATEILLFEGKSSDVIRSPLEESTKIKRYSQRLRNPLQGSNIQKHLDENKFGSHKSKGSPVRANNFQGFTSSYSRLLELSSCHFCSRERNMCQIISGIFTRTPLPYGYSKVTPIPAGVCNISIVEIKPSKNFFALKKNDATYALNGNWKIEAAGKYGIGGTLFNYSPSDGKRGEMLEAGGPLLEPLELMIIYQSPNPGIKYEYRIPMQQSPPSELFPVQANVPYNTQLTSSDHFIADVSHFPAKDGSFGKDASLQGFSLLHPREQEDPLTGISLNDWNSPSFPARQHDKFNTQLETELRKQQVISQPVPKVLDSPLISVDQNRHSVLASPVLSLGSTSFHNLIGISSEHNGEQEKYPGLHTTEHDNRILQPVRETAHQFPTNTDEEHKHINTKKMISFPTSRSIFHGRSNSSPKKGSRHRIRHNHRAKEVRPGPAVGGNTFFPLKSSKESKVSNVKYQKNIGKKKKEKKRKNRKFSVKKRRNRFHWTLKGFTDCSRTCGEGNQTSIVVCEHRRKGKLVADKFCEGLPVVKQTVISCNLNPCPAEWTPADWTDCSVTCGIGVQTRPLYCKQWISSSLSVVQSDSSCTGPKDFPTTICVREDCPSPEPKWKTGKWSSCSVSCGAGMKRRDIECVVMGQAAENQNMCSHVGTKPRQEMPCDMGTCSSNTWLYSEWSDKCSNSCGEGVHVRTVTCSSSFAKNNSKESCTESIRPEDSRSCSNLSGCQSNWFTGPWSECSVSCGFGREIRAVKCLKNTRGTWSLASVRNCKNQLKPYESRECILQPCKTQWFVSDWSKCSNSCGKGYQMRDVKCLNSSLKPSPKCPSDIKLVTRRSCISNICPKVSMSHDVKSKSEAQDKQLNIKQTQDKEFNLQTPFNPHAKDYSTENTIGKNIYKIETSENNASSKYALTGTPISTNIQDVKNNPQSNEIEVVYDKDNTLNIIQRKESQDDDTVAANDGNEKGSVGSKSLNNRPSTSEENKENKVTQKFEDGKYSDESNAVNERESENLVGNCQDRIKNCHLVFRARLCRLRYYNKLCCVTCKDS